MFVSFFVRLLRVLFHSPLSCQFLFARSSFWNPFQELFKAFKVFERISRLLEVLWYAGVCVCVSARGVCFMMALRGLAYYFVCMVPYVG